MQKIAFYYYLNVSMWSEKTAFVCVCVYMSESFKSENIFTYL